MSPFCIDFCGLTYILYVVFRNKTGQERGSTAGFSGVKECVGDIKPVALLVCAQMG